MKSLGFICQQVNTFKQIVLDFIYPRLCPICYERLSIKEKGLCPFCAVKLNPYRKDFYQAQERLYASPRFHELYSLFFYEKAGDVQKLIHAYKYKGQQDLVTYFLLKCKEQGYIKLWKEEKYDLIVAVPIEAHRLEERRYNQAGIMAKAIAQELHCSYTDSLLYRKQGAQSQTQKSKHERILSMKDAFAINQQIAQHYLSSKQKILLVDDVLTTGSTLVSICLELEKLGVKSIDVFTISVAI